MEQQHAQSTIPTDTPSPSPQGRKKSHRKRRFAILAVILLVLGIIAGVAANEAYDTYIKPHTTPTLNTGAEDGNAIISNEEEGIARVAEKVSPSVVSIITEVQSQSFRGVMTQEGAGTGIIVSANGYVMTNKHVVNDAQSVAVISADGTTYEGVRVVGTDPLNDVAFLKINGVSDLPAAEIGNSNSIRIGQKVIAIGNALGQYQNTVTSGIISGTGRPVVAQSGNQTESLTDLLQTDAAINSGNSGGPLLNMAGQVIGINTAVATDANGIGFAIPINATRGLLEGVLETGKVNRAYLGVNYISITPGVIEAYDLPVKKGAYVFAADGAQAVIAGSPADKAGINNKDIITKINGVEVGTIAGVASLIGQYQPGDQVTLSILRGSQTIERTVTLGAYTATTSAE